MNAENEKDEPETDIGATDFKKKYKLLKGKLKFLVYEHEALLDDLKKAQKKLLRVSRDRSFLLDRLLTFEKVEDTSSDDDTPARAENENGGGSGREKPTGRAGKKADSAALAVAAAGPEKSKKREGRASAGSSGEQPKKRLKTVKKPRGAAPSNGDVAGVPATGPGATGAASVGGTTGAGGASGAGGVSSSPSATGINQLPKSTSTPQPASGGREESERRRPRSEQCGRPKSAAALAATVVSSSATVGAASAASAAAVQPLSREEIERHLESRPRPLALEKAPLHMPADIFSNEASSTGSDDAASDDLEPNDLIIDTKWDA